MMTAKFMSKRSVLKITGAYFFFNIILLFLPEALLLWGFDPVIS